MIKIKVNIAYNQDCKEGLKLYEDNCIDAVVTDIPYELGTTTGKSYFLNKSGKQFKRKKGFMGMNWDIQPSVDTWIEIKRVMKDGSFAFILIGNRQDSHYILLDRLVKAGFVIHFSPIYWTYASGFTKASNIALNIDKRYIRDKLKAKLGRSPTGKEFEEAWLKFAKFTSTTIKKKDGTTEEAKIKYIPQTKNAKLLNGAYAGFQPKPAVETVVVCMKPLTEGTYIDQALKNQKGVTYLGEGSIPIGLESDKRAFIPTIAESKQKSAVFGQFSAIKNEKRLMYKPEGKFMPDLLVEDDILDDGTISKSHKHLRIKKGRKGKGIFSTQTPIHDNYGGYNEKGSYSRFFDLDLWFRHKILPNLSNLPEKVRKVFPFLIVPKPSQKEKEKNLSTLKKYKVKDGRKAKIDFPALRGETKKANTHPTVKPIKLMNYITLIATKPNEIVLDPFAGTGTTGISAMINNRRYILFEAVLEYYKILTYRIKPYKEQVKLTQYF